MQEEETGINIEDLWGNIRDAFTKTEEEILGHSRQKRKKWTSLETWGLIDERKGKKDDLCTPIRDGGASASLCRKEQGGKASGETGQKNLQ